MSTHGINHTTGKCLAAAVMLMAQAATACDDADEEMAMAAAYEAAKLAQSRAAPAVPGGEARGAEPAASTVPAAVAAADASPISGTARR